MELNNITLTIAASFAASFSIGIMADIITYGICKAFGFVKDIIKIGSRNLEPGDQDSSVG